MLKLLRDPVAICMLECIKLWLLSVLRVSIIRFIFKSSLVSLLYLLVDHRLRFFILQSATLQDSEWVKHFQWHKGLFWKNLNLCWNYSNFIFLVNDWRSIEMRWCIPSGCWVPYSFFQVEALRKGMLDIFLERGFHQSTYISWLDQGRNAIIHIKNLSFFPLVGASLSRHTIPTESYDAFI